MEFFGKTFWVICALWAQVVCAGSEWRFVPIKAGAFISGYFIGPKYVYGDHRGYKSIGLSHDFEILSTEVTQLQYVEIMGRNPSHFQDKKFCPREHQVIGKAKLCPNHPVEQISWRGAQNFLKRLNRRDDGYTYRLPTEAEWEYAAKAARPFAYFFGNEVLDLQSYAWAWENSQAMTHPVGEKLPNQWGLYDVYGNVGEWVQDTWSFELSGGVDPLREDLSVARVIRGGAWTTATKNFRFMERTNAYVGARRTNTGLRLVRVPKLP